MPTTLDYATPTRAPRSTAPAVAFLAATFAFAMTHFCVEWLTWDVLVFRLQVLGPATKPWEIDKLGDRFFFSMVIETAYLVPASVIVLLMQALQYRLAPAKILPLRRGGWLVGIVLGVAYCWIRWAVDGIARLTAMNYPESLDFPFSMVIAGVMGATLVAWRRQWR